MSEVVKYGVKPESAAAVIRVSSAHGGIMSRAEASSATGISLMTVGKAVDLLVRCGAVRTVTASTGASGRRPEMFELDESARIAAIDLSGDSSKLILLDLTGDVADTVPLPHEASEIFAALSDIAESDITCLCAGILAADTDADGIPIYGGAPDEALIPAASALRAPTVSVYSAADLLALSHRYPGSTLYAYLGAYPCSRTVRAGEVSRLGDISTVTVGGESASELGHLAGLSALLTSADRIVINGADDAISSAIETIHGKLPVITAPEADIEGIFKSQLRSDWLKSVCSPKM